MHRGKAEVDLLIVGSGPVGSTFARLLSEKVPGISILMTDLGPKVTSVPGMHVRNQGNALDVVESQVRSQGPTKYQYDRAAIRGTAAPTTLEQDSMPLTARPGTHLVSYSEPYKSGMPAAALSSNLGGMGAHWTCACPRPDGSENIPLFTPEESETYFAQAETLLQVTREAHPESNASRWIQARLAEVFDRETETGRRVGRMPLACARGDRGRLRWTGGDTILGPLLDASSTYSFELLSETLCREILWQGHRATGALLEDLQTGQQWVVSAKVVVVAADALRTPQLLWASQIRSSALGCYLNDQPQVFSIVTLDASISTIESASDSGGLPGPAASGMQGVFWVPFADPERPFHGQVMHFDASPLALKTLDKPHDARHVLGLGWFCAKDVRKEDRVSFSESSVDFLGMPRMQIDYGLSEKDEMSVRQAIEQVMRAAAALGTIEPGDEPRLLPAGSSLHYQGTTRMGESDQDSVCDSNSRVWGFENLFLGGNNMIPTATACNPTLTSCALAIRACEAIIPLLA